MNKQLIQMWQLTGWGCEENLSVVGSRGPMYIRLTRRRLEILYAMVWFQHTFRFGNWIPFWRDPKFSIDCSRSSIVRAHYSKNGPSTEQSLTSTRSEVVGTYHSGKLSYVISRICAAEFDRVFASRKEEERLEIENEITHGFCKENDLPQSNDIGAIRQNYQNWDASTPTKRGRKKCVGLSQRGKWDFI